jgi:large subunit ribosomal protein L21
LHAIIRMGGHQYTVKPDEAFMVDRLESAPGEKVTVSDVLFVSDGAKAQVGTPTVAGAMVELEVLSHAKGPKIRVFKQKRRKNFRKHTGARAYLTQVRVLKITG